MIDGVLMGCFGIDIYFPIRQGYFRLSGFFGKTWKFRYRWGYHGIFWDRHGYSQLDKNFSDIQGFLDRYTYSRIDGDLTACFGMDMDILGYTWIFQIIRDFWIDMDFSGKTRIFQIVRDFWIAMDIPG